ncbi:hypothetical protein GGR52DRAFT_24301 [Hypoxylon sp. FL1284]|nr:hypothetical protein GGR52DRAFT_24301 [Hypoxylon sp. FL1284]
MDPNLDPIRAAPRIPESSEGYVACKCGLGRKSTGVHDPFSGHEFVPTYIVFPAQQCAYRFNDNAVEPLFNGRVRAASSQPPGGGDSHNHGSSSNAPNRRQGGGSGSRNNPRPRRSSNQTQRHGSTSDDQAGHGQTSSHTHPQSQPGRQQTTAGSSRNVETNSYLYYDHHMRERYNENGSPRPDLELDRNSDGSPHPPYFF